jgi:hypothetical protein
MTIPFAGGETEAFTIISGTVAESTSGGTYDSTYSRCSIAITGSTGVLNSLALGSLATAWTHFEYNTAFISNAARTHIQWLNSSGTAVFRLQYSAGGGVLQAQYWNGSAWTNIGSTFSITTSRASIDVKIVCGGSGSMEVYLAGSLVTSGSASMTSVTNIDKVQLLDNISGSTSYYSQVIVATSSTVGWKFFTKPPTGNGANTAWTGTFADVDETVVSDADFITTAVANDVETYTGAALSLGSGTVKAVVVSMRAKNDGVSPVNIQGALRRSSTNYFSGNLSINSGYGPMVAIWETDPSTSAAWVGSDAASATIEFGAKAIA